MMWKSKWKTKLNPSMCARYVLVKQLGSCWGLIFPPAVTKRLLSQFWWFSKANVSSRKPFQEFVHHCVFSLGFHHKQMVNDIISASSPTSPAETRMFLSLVLITYPFVSVSVHLSTMLKEQSQKRTWDLSKDLALEVENRSKDRQKNQPCP